jgi:CheY-like chemotaxis protein
MIDKPAILLVEDNEDDVFLMERALKAAGITNPLRVAEDGQQAIDYLSGNGQFTDRESNPLPALVFLDLKLPFVKGLDVLAWARQAPNLSSLNIVILTSSEEPSDLSEARRLGANSYLVKPPTATQLLTVAQEYKL